LKTAIFKRQKFNLRTVNAVMFLSTVTFAFGQVPEPDSAKAVTSQQTQVPKDQRPIEKIMSIPFTWVRVISGSWEEKAVED